ncbi:hypothetical protein ACFC0M_40320, partial [Streptomyces sp. NPDC056149]
AHHSASGAAGNPDAVAARAAAPLTPGVPRLPGAPGARPDGPTGGSRQGGAGLHRSRGGARATGDPAAAHGRGQHGPGEHPDKGGRGRPEERRRRYLDEDEATWTPPRELPPPVIE